jgi:hypothetical protein
MSDLSFRVVGRVIASNLSVTAELKCGLSDTPSKIYRPVDMPVDINVDNIWG